VVNLPKTAYKTEKDFGKYHSDDSATVAYRNHPARLASYGITYSNGRI